MASTDEEKDPQSQKTETSAPLKHLREASLIYAPNWSVAASAVRCPYRQCPTG